ncbi:protein kinase domain-containing protein [Nannocystaceae bacterium ST9]
MQLHGPLDDEETNDGASDVDSSEGIPRPAHDSLDVDLKLQGLLAKLFAGEEEVVRLEHYELERELGRGAMGVVYAARDTKLDRRVAIKRLQARGDAELRGHLIREARAMAKLAHPNVVPIYEIGEDRDAAFIVMEYVEGVTLRRWCEAAPRSIAQIFEVFVAAGRGLAAAHAKAMVHRDFKPDNVMVGVDGRVRVMDFGLARFDPRQSDWTTDAEIGLSETVAVTRAGALIGTPAYMAPEQLCGERADALSDQFGFCVAFHEALHGQRPFRASSLAQLRAEIDAQRISSSDEVPDWLRELVARGLKRTPTDRHASMEALLDALEAGAREAALGRREPPAYVFVAHAGADKPAVLRLCEGLLDHAVRPWLDLWDVEPSVVADPFVAQALHDAPAVLICHGPAGGEQLQREYGDALRARVAADPSTVVRATLPAGTDAGLPSMPGVTLDEARWFEGIAELARLLGIDRRRAGWLTDEARRVGIGEHELSPYRGPTAYAEADARWMFGRGRAIADLLELVRTNEARFVTVVGIAGSGKSSLVAAGVCPALRHGAVGGQSWKIGHLRPGARPCEALAHVLVDLRGPSEDPVVDALKVARLRDRLIADPGTLALIIERIVGGSGGSTSKVLLVVDPLDELLEALDDEATSSEASSFVRNLRAATARGSSLWVMATLDSELMPRCLEVPDLASAFESGLVYGLPSLTKARIHDAIVKPARRVGFEVEPELLERLVDAASEPVTRLARLQLLLCELWRRRDETRRLLIHAAFDPALAVASPAGDASDSSRARPLPLVTTRLDLEAARQAFRRRREAVASDDPRVVFVAEGVRKAYRVRGFCLTDIDLVLRRGEIVGLVGANASGKTTLLRIVAGELGIDGGVVRYPSLAEPGQWRAIRAGIAHVQQQPLRWYGALQDTLRYEAALHGSRGKHNDDEVEFMLHRLGLDGYADATWSEISGGYQTRFELARALLKRPQLLILDEPLAPLDVIAQQLYLQDLRDITRSSRDPPAVLISSQHLHEVESVADGLLALRHGQPMFAGTLAQLRDSRVANSFELAFEGEAWAARAAIARFGPDARMVGVGMNHILTVPRDVTLDQVVRVLVEGSLKLSYVRDISGSTRRLFETQED